MTFLTTKNDISNQQQNVTPKQSEPHKRDTSVNEVEDEDDLPF